MRNKKLSLCNVIIFPPASLPQCLVIQALYCVEITCFSLAYWEMPRLGLCWYICSVFSWKPRALNTMSGQDSPAKFKKMLWMKTTAMNRIAFTDSCPHLHFKVSVALLHETLRTALIWYQLITGLLHRLINTKYIFLWFSLPEFNETNVRLASW